MPARLRDVARAIEALGGSVEEPNKGSHFKARLNSQMYPLPAHNGWKTELADVYIRGLCRTLGLDEAVFRALL
jgi:hypothetical protein